MRGKGDVFGLWEITGLVKLVVRIYFFGGGAKLHYTGRQSVVRVPRTLVSFSLSRDCLNV